LSKEFCGFQGMTAYFRSVHTGRALVDSKKLRLEGTGYNV